MESVKRVKKEAVTFFEHLDELRKRLLIALTAVGVCSVVSYAFSDRLLNFLLKPIQQEIGQLYFFTPQEAFVVKIKIALLSGFLVALPVVLWQLWLFISPALHVNEKKAAWPLVIVTTSLFVSGVLFAFFLVLPVAFKFLLSMETEFLKPMISVSEYIDFLNSMLLAFGISFNMPVFVMAFVLSGMVDAETLNRYQKHAIVLIFIAAAILTPGPDIASQFLLAIPLLILFEISVLGAFLIKKRKPNRAKP